MNQENQRIHELFLGYLAGTLSPVDQQEFWGYLNDPAFEQPIKQLLAERFDKEVKSEGLSEAKQQRLLDHIFEYEGDNHVLKPDRWFRWLPYAAAILAIVMAVSFMIYSVRNKDVISGDRDNIVMNEDVLPGTNKAFLTLADGRVIDLSETESGIVIESDRIAYYDDRHEVVGLSTDTVQQLALVAPRGGTYQLTLADGTRVWLNAGSTLIYPSSFDEHERVVELRGEAFFEVSKSTTPFRVHSAGQAVEVLGTTFNISADADEPATVTALVSGSVQVVEKSANTVNKRVPGEQSSLHKDGTIQVRKVTVEQYTAWKEGLFAFQKTSFEEMMRQISRWYDVEVVYEKGIPNDTFTGTLSRDLSLMTVLEFLNVSDVPDVQLHLVGKQLIVE